MIIKTAPILSFKVSVSLKNIYPVKILKKGTSIFKDDPFETEINLYASVITNCPRAATMPIAIRVNAME